MAVRQDYLHLTHQVGNPLQVDALRSHGQDGGYEFSLATGSSAIWNRKSNHDRSVDQEAVVDQENFAYVTVSNGGLHAANEFEVRVFQSDATESQNWSAAWNPLITNSVPSPNSMAPGTDAIIGRFVWTPATDNSGLLFLFSVIGDRSNVDRFANASVDTLRWVQFNNIALRTLNKSQHSFAAIPQN